MSYLFSDYIMIIRYEVAQAMCLSASRLLVCSRLTRPPNKRGFHMTRLVYLEISPAFIKYLYYSLYWVESGHTGRLRHCLQCCTWYFRICKLIHPYIRRAIVHCAFPIIIMNISSDWVKILWLSVHGTWTLATTSSHHLSCNIRERVSYLPLTLLATQTFCECFHLYT